MTMRFTRTALEFLFLDFRQEKDKILKEWEKTTGTRKVCEHV